VTTPNPASNIEVWISTPPGIISSTVADSFGGAEVEQQSKPLDKAKDALKVNSEEFISSWRSAYTAVESVFATDKETSTSSFKLDSVTARLSLSASGKVAFIGELGGELSFEATFKRS
jgi:hypothetical protein